MKIMAPKFFYKTSILSFLLMPLGLALSLITKCRRIFIKSYKAKIPVICCGNITLGGTGKTPTALWIGDYFQKKGKKVVYLTRGWKGKEKGPLLVQKEHTAQQVGDEALLLAAKAYTIVSKNRKKGAKLAEKLDMDIIIMDDGFQNPYLHKDFCCLIFEGKTGTGNQHLFPAGPLRESLKSGLAISNCALIIGQDKTNLKDKIKKIKTNFPIFDGKIDAIPTPLLNKNIPCFAFAGIGFPEKFFNTLRKSGFSILKTKAFPDHHNYTKNEIKKLYNEAAYLKAQLITTEKDFIKLTKEQRKEIKPFPVTLTLENKIDFLHLIENCIEKQKKDLT